MVSHISIASLALLYNDLRVKDDPQARHEETAHYVAQAEAGTPNQPGHHPIHAHALQHGHYDAAKEEERAPLAEQRHRTERTEGCRGVDGSLTQKFWLNFCNLVDTRPNEKSK